MEFQQLIYYSQLFNSMKLLHLKNLRLRKRTEQNAENMAWTAEGSSDSRLASRSAGALPSFDPFSPALV